MMSSKAKSCDFKRQPRLGYIAPSPQLYLPPPPHTQSVIMEWFDYEESRL